MPIGVLPVAAGGGGGGGGGPAPAILPSNTYVWACDDPVGSPTLANTGANGPAGALTRIGTQTLQSGRIGRTSKSVYFEAPASSDVAISTSITAPLVTGVTIEVFAIFDIAPFNNGCAIFEVASNTGNSNYLLIGADNNGMRCNAGIYGAFDTQSAYYPPTRGVPTYLAVTYQAQVMLFYVNGRLYTGNQTGNLTQDFTIAALANLARPGLQAYPLSGNVMQARISNIVQPASYFRSNADTLFKM